MSTEQFQEKKNRRGVGRYRELLSRKAMDYTEAVSLALITLVVILLWPTPFVYPFKLLVVFFHEASHGLMAYATGGRVVEMALRSDLSGHCVVVGGNTILVASAGYLGSMLSGVLLLLLVKRSEQAPYVSQALGGVMLLVALLFIRPFVSFGQLFALLSAVAFFLIGLKMAPWVNRVLLQGIGIASCLKALLDMYTVSFANAQMPSDAVILAEHTGIPAVVWGIFWMLLGMAVLWWALPYLLRKPRPAADYASGDADDSAASL